MTITADRRRPIDRNTGPLTRYCIESVHQWCSAQRNIKHAPRFSKYSPLSCSALPSSFVSPPKTINTLPTSALAWPTRGDGISPPVSSRVADRSFVEIKYKSFFLWSRTRPPNKKNSPVAVAVAGSEAPYRGNGDGDGEGGIDEDGFGSGGGCNDTGGKSQQAVKEGGCVSTTDTEVTEWVS